MGGSSRPCRIGRNDPCPCGSGRKYKRCCASQSTWTGDSLWHRMRAAEGRCVDATADWLRQRHGREILEAAFGEFLLGEEDEGDLLDHPEFENLFIPWSLFAWAPGGRGFRPETWPRERLGLAFLHERGDRLDPFERRFLEEVCAQPFGFHQILQVEPQRSLLLRDLLTGEERRVCEKLATTVASRGAILFTRVVSLDGVSIMTGAGLHLIPPIFAPRLLDLRDALLPRGEAAKPGALLALDGVLRGSYFEIVEQIENPPPIELRNTDGDPLELIQLRYALRCAPEQAFEALKGLALDHSDEDLLSDAKIVAGRLGEVSFPWIKRGNKQNKSWDNTILGHIEIGQGRLRVDVNSRPRAKRIRREIERRIGGEAIFEAESAQSSEALLAVAEGKPKKERAKQRAERERFEADPAVRELTERMGRQHWESWVDQRLPVLGGRTPREAVRDPRGRERLDALLLEFEWSAAETRNPLVPDVGALRRQLGL